jgi:acetamidase/formamidase
VDCIIATTTSKELSELLVRFFGIIGGILRRRTIEFYLRNTMNPDFIDLLGALALSPQGRSRRISSNEQPNWNDGNFDSTYLAPGETLDMPLLEGPGFINHLWFTSHAGGMGELNALSLRIYWGTFSYRTTGQ